MKKFIALLLVTFISISAFIGCGGASSGGETSVAASGPAPDTSTETSNGTEIEKPNYHFGGILYSKEDLFCSILYSNLNYAAEALGVKITWAIGSLDTTAQISDAENLVAAGVDAIFCIPLAELSTQKIAALCQQNEVYYANILKNVVDPTIKAEVEGYSYFVGLACGDDEGNAKQLMQYVEEAGCKNVAPFFFEESSPSATRNTGFREGIEEYGLNQVAEGVIGTNSSAIPATVQNILNTNPDLDAIISGASAGGFGEAFISTLTSMKSDVKFACFDIFGGITEAFENGTVIAACGGQNPQAVYVFMLLYNAVDGHRLEEETTYLYQKFIFLTNLEDCEPYEAYLANPDYQIYEAEDILNMAVRFNPDVTIEDYRQMMDEYSLENVVAEAQTRQ